MAKIVRVEVLQVDLVPKTVRTDAIQSFATQETPMVRIHTSDGIVGTGYSYTIGTGGSSVIGLLRDHLAPRLLGRDPLDIEAIWKSLFFSTHATAVGAITSLALAAIDTALWDAKCLAAGRPLWKEAGGAQASVPVYSTEGGWLHVEPQALVDDALSVRAQGFGGAKIKVGRPHVSEDIARLSAVRDAVGPGFEIMVDANQAFTSGEAIRRARQYEPLDLAWFEEPLPAEDLGGHIRLAASTSTPDRGRRVHLSSQSLPGIPATRRLRDRAGGRRAHWRHHALAQGRAPCGDLQRADLPALPDGVARLAMRGGAERRLGGMDSAAR